MLDSHSCAFLPTRFGAFRCVEGSAEHHPKAKGFPLFICALYKVILTFVNLQRKSAADLLRGEDHECNQYDEEKR